MKQHCDGRNVWRILVISFVLALAWSCATAPPFRPIGDIKEIVGKWEGTASFDYAMSGPATLIIYESGAYESNMFQYRIGSRQPDARSSGTGRLSEGKFDIGGSQTYTLHEGGGKRVLIYAGPGDMRLALEPAKK